MYAHRDRKIRTQKAKSLQQEYIGTICVKMLSRGMYTTYIVYMQYNIENI